MKANTQFLPQTDEQEFNVVLMPKMAMDRLQIVAREKGISEVDALNEAISEYVEKRSL
ncbi:MAG: hypothetical protein HQK96_14055 [Nitrospirae bacterium]|nr:hypothetical protein [Nitrospirota bacterium]